MTKGKSTDAAEEPREEALWMTREKGTFGV